MMKKLIALISVIVAGIVLYKIESGEIGVTTLTSVIHIQEINEVEQVTAAYEFEINGEDRIFAALLSPDKSQINNQHALFEEIAQDQRVDQIVVVGENHLRRGFFDIAFDEMDGLLGEIENENIGESERAFWEENVLRPIRPMLDEYFPEAEVHGVLIKEFANAQDVDELAELLASNLNENSLVIVSTHFSDGLDQRVSEFQDEMSMEVLRHQDLAGVEDLNVDSRPSIRFLLGYLENLGAQSVEFEDSIFESDRSHIFAKFYEGEIENDRDLTIMAFGDMMLGRYVRTLMNENGLDYIFRDIQGPELRFFSGADVVFGNLEGPIKGEGKSGGTSMNFAFNRDIGPLLARYNFNLMSIANNHAMDQGAAGREETIEVLEENGIGWCGHEREVDPDSVYYGSIGNHSYAFLCFSDINAPLDDDAAVALIQRVRPEVDYLVVSIHWGPEYFHTPHKTLQVEPAHMFIDAGADFIIGHHPHVVQSFEEYKGKLIFYSLGNFVFDQYWSQKTQEELAIGIVLDDDDDGEGLSTKVYLFPMKSEASQSYLLTDGAKAEYLEKFIGYGDYSEKMKEMIRDGIVEIN